MSVNLLICYRILTGYISILSWKLVKIFFHLYFLYVRKHHNHEAIAAMEKDCQCFLCKSRVYAIIDIRTGGRSSVVENVIILE